MPQTGRPRHSSLLTPGEQRVLTELRKGGTNAEIAVRLGLSPETVKTHIASMLSKLDLGDRRALAAWQPREESARRPILGALAVPPGLNALKAPLVWVGAVLAGAAVITVAAIFIAGMLATGEHPIAAPLDCHTPLLSTVAHATDTRPDLIVVSDGSHDALLLQWTGGPENTSRWQYRMRRWENSQPLEWEAWTDVPDSTANTCSYRATGLREDTAYGFRVRAVVAPPRAAEAYAVSPTSETGATQRRGEPPELRAGRLAQGDGVTEWVVAGFAIVIPAGMRVTTAPPETSASGESIVPVFETASRSVIQLTPSGDLVEWHAYSPSAVLVRELYSPRPDNTDRVTPHPHNVNTLFEEIVASVRSLVPTPADAESAVNTPAAPSLLVFSDGSTDALWIEWRDSSEGVTGWQYWAIEWEDGRSFPWKDWMDIPPAAAATGRYRVTGLHDDVRYEFKVRPLRGEVPGDAIQGHGDVEWGVTNSRGRLPYLHQGTVAEGDGSTEWKPYGYFLVTIPAGMQVRGDAGDPESDVGAILTDIGTGSRLLLTYTGEEWSRTIRAPHVSALFDQIVASVRTCGPVCTLPPQTLLAFSDGAPDSLLLEWGRADRTLSQGEWSAPDGLTGWQYRLRPYRVQPGGWSEWTDFPESSGASRRGRVSGLRPDTLYQFEVRPVVAALAGATSARTRGHTQSATGPRIIHGGYPIEGDGRTEWRLPGGLIVVTIPAGMLVENDGHARGGINDLDSNSWLLLDLTTGAEERREIRNAVEGGRDVDALFDQIVDSARVVGR